MSSKFEVVTETDSAQDQPKRLSLLKRAANFLVGSSTSITNVEQLPPSVLYAMQYKRARLEKPEVERLFTAGLARPALYLALKGADNDDAAQLKTLQTFADKGFNYARLTREDLEPSLKALEPRPDTVEVPYVEGEKLGQFSRHGFANSIDIFDQKLDEVLAGRPDTSIFMVANYPYIGLDVLAKHSLDRGNTLGILKPERVHQTELPVGFRMENGASGVSVDPIMYDFDRPRDAIIFDDVLKNGHTMQDVCDFWVGEGEVPHVADFVAAVRVISTV